MSASPASTASAGDEQATSRSNAAPALLDRFRNRLHAAHALMAVALLGAASLPQAAQAQHMFDPVNVPAPPGSGSGGPFGGSGGSSGDPSGCGAACDGSDSGNGGDESGPVVRGSSHAETSNCQTMHALRNREANELAIRNQVHLWANPGDYFEVILLDGVVDRWVFSCTGQSCGDTVLDFANTTFNNCAA